MTTWYFYPRPPRGGRLVFFEVVQHIVPFLSTPSARRATFRHDHRRDRRRISIHALREEGDLLPAFLTRWTTRFLSTPSARRATWSFLSLVRHPSRFLSTPSARRATCPRVAAHKPQSISIHALREEGDAGPLDLCHLRFISIHALREEGDRGQRGQLQVLHISIHALREEGD